MKPRYLTLAALAACSIFAVVASSEPPPSPSRNPIRPAATAAKVATERPSSPARNPLRPLGPPSSFRPAPPAAWGPVQFARDEPLSPPPPLPAQHPNRAKKGAAPESKPVARRDQPADKPRVGWSEEDIAKAKEECAQLLSSVTLDHSPAEPIKRGACGAPAPIAVRTIGANPKIELSPPPTLTCAMAAALDKWAKKVMQPEARKHLNSPVVSLRNAASYVCRNRYGAKNGRLSEHAKANAFDISAFTTQSGEVVTLAGNWRVGEGGGSPGLPWRNPIRTSTSGAKTGQSAKETFLRNVHAGACDIFGTVLGPEANAAHRDHFHFDMMQRRAGYCR